ncbi:NAD-linked malic enzyme; malate oxidoreductase [Salmonella enterica subsp. enterica serovar Sendai]|nr:NAD-linked malic enzyme; malate oxidoreductase [Salmonella enterica subsp. enterica serovar Sendai]
METTTKKARSLYIPYAGPVLLEFPLLNKGSAFSVEERRNFNLSGLLPEVVESIEEQAERAWLQYQGFKTEIDKHIYLRNIQDTNETLFYRLVQNHLFASTIVALGRKTKSLTALPGRSRSPPSSDRRGRQISCVQSFSTYS